MKKIVFFLSIVVFFVSCKEKNNKNSIAKESIGEAETLIKIPSITDRTLENAVIYEANIRQYSVEGTFKAFTKDIPELKKLGIKIVWIMPIYPISTTKSKGSLGSYYALSAYTQVNPEFGTNEDFAALIDTAHQNGMYVLLDWVANHTGWDHPWIKEHPAYYTKNKEGEITHTVDTDWTDVADLDYTNQEIRNKMQQSMEYWIKEYDIDGFRCDVAAMVPLDFWETTIAALQKVKPIFMLAEAWEPELLSNAFDMGYAWDTHHVMNHIANGKNTVEAWDQRMVQIDTLYQKDDILMNFTSNHDENSWNGTVKERMGDAAEIFAILSYVAPGMPLIYSGQEYDMNKRLLFFEKDTIIKKKGIFFPLYEKLGKLKKENPALHSGKDAASYTRNKTSNDREVLAFTRKKDTSEIIFLGNLSKNTQTFTVEMQGKFKNYFSNEIFQFQKGKKHSLKAWEYMVLLNE